MKKIVTHLLIIIPAGVIITLAALAPSVLIGYKDANVLDKVETEPAAGLTEGFRYILSPNERLHILSMALKTQVPLQTDYAALVRGRSADTPSSFAYTENRRGPSPGELTYEDALKACDTALAELRKLGKILDCRFDPENDGYDVRLYTAVDMSDPQKNISVWQIQYTPGRLLSVYSGALLEAWLDAENGALYGFSMRTTPDGFDPDAIMGAWHSITGIRDITPLPDDSLLLETTPHYKRYAVEGLDNESIIVTVGYYEGINEVFLRIT